MREAREAREAREEKEALGRVAGAMSLYNQCASAELGRWELQMGVADGSSGADIVAASLARMTGLAEPCIARNQEFFEALLSTFNGTGVPEHLSLHLRLTVQGQKVSAEDASRVRYVLRNLMRDWSAEGKPERDASYKRILDKLEELLPPPPPLSSTTERPSLLIPGAGLGRLMVDAVLRGYQVEGNEFSYYMLLTSSFMLNLPKAHPGFTIHPWVLDSCNVKRREDQMKGMFIPDIYPIDHCMPNRMGMCGGDFQEVYSSDESAGKFDAVVTCFFLDTARNVIEYLAVIKNVLKENGVWINFGPLLYHWSSEGSSYSDEEELSVELTLEEVLEGAQKMGFELIAPPEERTQSTFASNPNSMQQTVFNCAFFAMRVTHSLNSLRDTENRQVYKNSITV